MVRNWSELGSFFPLIFKKMRVHCWARLGVIWPGYRVITKRSQQVMPSYMPLWNDNEDKQTFYGGVATHYRTNGKAKTRYTNLLYSNGCYHRNFKFNLQLLPHFEVLNDLKTTSEIAKNFFLSDNVKKDVYEMRKHGLKEKGNMDWKKRMKEINFYFYSHGTMRTMKVS